MKELVELATGLQNSNIKEIADLAKGYLTLAANYEEIQHKYVMACSESIMAKHEKLFKKLAESGD